MWPAVVERTRLPAVVISAAIAAGACTSSPQPTRVVVSLRAAEAPAVTAALNAIERAVATTPGLVAVRSVGCTTGGAVVVETATSVTSASATQAAVHTALSAIASTLPPGVSDVKVQALGDDVRLLSVRADDPFVARRFVDDSLLPAIRAISGVVEVRISGGRREPQLAIDPERLLAADVSLPEVLTTLRTASDLDKAVIKSSPAGVVHLRDVATQQDASAAEPLRKDGGVEVRIRGALSSTGAVDAAIAAVPVPRGIAVKSLDNDSVEVVTVLVARDARGQAQGNDPAADAVADGAVDAAFADVAAAALSIPGIHTFRRGRSLQLTLDPQRVAALGLGTPERRALADVTALATDGLVVPTKTGPVRALLGAAATPEALLRTRVATRKTADGTDGVALFDVARAAFVEEQRHERLDFRPARRLRLSFDAGVRKPALAELDTRIAAIQQARPGLVVVVERDHDTAPLDAVCP